MPVAISKLGTMHSAPFFCGTEKRMSNSNNDCVFAKYEMEKRETASYSKTGFSNDNNNIISMERKMCEIDSRGEMKYGAF